MMKYMKLCNWSRSLFPFFLEHQGVLSRIDRSRIAQLLKCFASNTPRACATEVSKRKGSNPRLLGAPDHLRYISFFDPSTPAMRKGDNGGEEKTGGKREENYGEYSGH